MLSLKKIFFAHILRKSPSLLFLQYMKNLEKILNLSQKRIDYFCDEENVRNWYQGSETYFRSIITETEEARAENREQNHIYLEDELGDIFWNFCCLLSSLEREGKISHKKEVFRRCYQKFSERIGEEGRGGHNWDEVKKSQKIALKKENLDYKNFLGISHGK